jgi:hypothetical protein
MMIGVVNTMPMYRSNIAIKHRWRLTLAPQFRGDSKRTPMLARVSRILASITGKTPAQCIRIANDEIIFLAPTRVMIQRHDELLDCGYAAIVVPRDEPVPTITITDKIRTKSVQRI